MRTVTSYDTLQSRIVLRSLTETLAYKDGSGLLTTPSIAARVSNTVRLPSVAGRLYLHIFSRQQTSQALQWALAMPKARDIERCTRIVTVTSTYVVLSTATVAAALIGA
ncbi:hypothetical protein EVG20_g2299 [Dentipellis fragilis]|uniref:Uncharacterized protein n=1 Tax=Dentipellis fragilis TaxID=205917 RepID=A0A4Y9Z9A7_9AGAM|nr:hypothetical protein EVG20_g2299 [Dentipellis fragilis]